VHRGTVYSMHMSMARSNVVYVDGMNVSQYFRIVEAG